MCKLEWPSAGGKKNPFKFTHYKYAKIQFFLHNGVANLGSNYF